ncbi:MAG: pilus assembly protein TadG-related protein [Acetobacteraceae bacterium]
MAIGSILRPGRAGWLRRLRRARGGNVAMIFALTAGALVVATGAGVDMTRGVDVHSELQSIADAAALAGASAYVNSGAASTAQTVATDYMNNAIATLPPNGGVSFTVTTGTIPASGTATGYTVTVQASTSVATTLLSMVAGSVPVAVSSEAENPVVTFSVNFGNFVSSAWDNNSIYYYLMPSKGSAIPTSGGAPSGAVLLYDNKNALPSKPISVTLTASQKIGFALQNVTSTRYQGDNYGCNQYGACYGSTQWFYSELNPPSQDAYPGITNNRSLQVYTQAPGQAVPNEVIGATFTTPFAYATPTCSQLGTQTAWFYWNDMGGGTDDLDYNDMEYSFSCASPSGGSGGSGTGPTSVVLIK